MADYERLIERLLARNTLGPRADGKVGIEECYDNPDGPEAAEAISTLLKERDALKDLVAGRA
jgi:hypothetical protein